MSYGAIITLLHKILLTFVLESLLSSSDNVILQRFGKCGKQCTVTSHTYNQMLIVLRMCLCIQQCLSAYNIELHMHSLLIEIGTNQCNKFLKALTSGKC